ncbi:MAG: hypothetical protein JKY54_12335 [Flavobacteriales bacterium]|nr:hypothetical protein [Flavobacteriales bacterium]
MQNKLSFFIAAIAVILFATCKPSIDPPELKAGDANLSSVVYFGDNYLTGFQNGALYFEGQNKSLAALIHGQFEDVGGGSILQPFIEVGKSIGPNSKVWDSPYVARSEMKWKLGCDGVTGISPVKDLLTTVDADFLLNGSSQFVPTNVSVPFATSSELLSPVTGFEESAGGNMYYNYFATNPTVSTPLSDAMAKNPTFSVIWMGMENIWRYGRTGGTTPGSIPSAASFEADLDSVLSNLSTAGGQGVIANIPDFRTLPYYTTIAYNGADLNANKADSLNDSYHIGGINSHIQFYVGLNGFVVGDPAAPNGYRQMVEGEYITLSVPVDSMKCNFYGLLVKLIGDQYSLLADEVAFMESMTNQYNAIIAAKAAEYNIALVDMNSYFNSVESGIVWNAVDINTEFVSGGFFGLDGIHPHQQGYSLMANEFILAINAHYNAVIPTGYCPDCEAVRFP